MAALEHATTAPANIARRLDHMHDYLIEEDDMGDSAAQTRLRGYLEAVLVELLARLLREHGMDPGQS